MLMNMHTLFNLQFDNCIKSVLFLWVQSVIIGHYLQADIGVAPVKIVVFLTTVMLLDLTSLL